MINYFFQQTDTIVAIFSSSQISVFENRGFRNVIQAPAKLNKLVKKKKKKKKDMTN